ncbi:MAG: beta-N-acetylhexosaminidase [Hyphomonadaceae bacterium]|nr:MAG: beta-N-acetylhexosaminidase [Hyphomonadaceae bacterium]
MSLACIIDVAGTSLSKDEIAFFKDAQPWAFILFGRSCANPDQIRALTSEIRGALGRDCLIFLDQEGGRVQRLKPPLWPQWPTYSLYGAIYETHPEQAREAAYLHHRLIAHELRAVGIDADCAPCLDLAIEGAHSVIGDRAFSANPEIIADLGRHSMNGLHDGGVTSVIKHIPGHGRANADSHHELPIVTEGHNQLAADFAPFKALNDAPMAMTAHVKYTAYDAVDCATTSAKIINEIIRGEMGFDGLLVSDDISMKALSGSNREKAAACYRAGCEIPVLCNASLEDRQDFVAACIPLAGKAQARAEAAEAIARKPIAEFDLALNWARFAELTRIKSSAEISFDPTERR